MTSSVPGSEITVLQRGLHVNQKSERVSRYIKQMVYEIGVISHYVGGNEPRKLSRKHARMMGADGISIELDALYPYPNYHLNRSKMAERLAAARK